MSEIDLNTRVQCPKCQAEIERTEFEGHQVKYTDLLYARKIFTNSEEFQKKIRWAKKIRPWMKYLTFLSGITLAICIYFFGHIMTIGSNSKVEKVRLVILFVLIVVCFFSMSMILWCDSRESKLFKKFFKEYEKKNNDYLENQRKLSHLF
jgi:uncharacterized membrane protein SirB2